MGIIRDMASSWGEMLALPFNGYDWTDRTLGVMSWLLTGAVAGMVGLVGYNVHMSHKDTEQLARMDAGPTLIFKDTAECVAKGKDATFCVDAFRAATEKHERNGYFYRAEQDCQSLHGAENCTGNMYHWTTFIPVGKVMVPISHSEMRYYPSFGGFQVAENNGQLAIPLYKSSNPATLVRPDGRSVSMTP